MPANPYRPLYAEPERARVAMNRFNEIYRSANQRPKWITYLHFIALAILVMRIVAFFVS